jgi:hypothetical protein
MNNIIYKVGDLVMAHKQHDYDSPSYEWGTAFPYPIEYAIITKITEVTSSYKKYYVKFIDGAEDCMDVSEIKLRAYV